jgi:hypothetical protein
MIARLALLVVIGMMFFANSTGFSVEVLVTRRGKKITMPAQRNKLRLSYNTIKDTLASWNERMLKGDQVKQYPLTSMDYTVFALHVDKWLAYRDLELDTLIERVWYIKVKAVLKNMANIKRYIEHSRMDGNNIDKAKLEQKRKMFIVAYNQFRKLAAKPIKITKNKLTKLLRDKKLRKTGKK